MPASRVTPLSTQSLPRVWTAKVCPFAQLVNISLAEKDVEVEKVEVDLANKSEDFLCVNPGGKVPVIEDAGHILLESNVLIEYVDETWDNPGHNLLPKDTVQRAKARVMWEKIRNVAVGPFYKILFNPDEKVRQALFEKFVTSYIELASEFDKEGPYLMGKEFTVADIALFPFKQRVALLDTFFNLKFPDSPQLESLNRWYKFIEQRPSIASTKPEQEYLAELYGRYIKSIQEQAQKKD